MRAVYYVSINGNIPAESDYISVKSRARQKAKRYAVKPGVDAVEVVKVYYLPDGTLAKYETGEVIERYAIALTRGYPIPLKYHLIAYTLDGPEDKQDTGTLADAVRFAKEWIATGQYLVVHILCNGQQIRELTKYSE